ncbi:MAG: hypothetical protein QOE33_1636 [Acidobacteriota bacterium]|nr:hypothetical protein [Acidobacteriota bacterium]
MFAGRKLTRTTADEVDDFDAVAIGEFRLAPMRAAHDLAVQFYSHAFRREGQLPDEFADRHAGCDLALFAVDDYLQMIAS